MAMASPEYLSVVVPDLVERAKAEYKGKRYKTTIPILGLDGQKYYTSIFNDQIKDEVYCSPEFALDMYRYYDPKKDQPAYAVRIGAYNQASYEADGIRRQLDFYKLTNLRNKVVVDKVDPDKGQCVLIAPDLGDDFDTLMGRWGKAGRNIQDRPISPDTFHTLWDMIMQLQLDHGDISTPSNIVLVDGQYPLLIDRTISTDYVNTLKKYPYTFWDTYDFMIRDLLYLTKEWKIKNEDLHPYIKAVLSMGLRDPNLNYRKWLNR